MLLLLQAFRRTPPLCTAFIVRDIVSECNAVARHSRVTVLDAVGAAAALAGSQPAGKPVRSVAPPPFPRAAALYTP
jgi:hypothetical protein